MRRTAPILLPWPRFADDDPATPLGVDIEARRFEILKIVHKYIQDRGRPMTLPLEDLIQEIFLAIALKNRYRSAHDPRKSSFGHYVYMISNNVCCNLAMKSKAGTRIPVSSLSSIHDLDI